MNQPLQDKRILLLKTSRLYDGSRAPPPPTSAQPEAVEASSETKTEVTSEKKKPGRGRGLKPEKEGTRGLCQIFKPRTNSKEGKKVKINQGEVRTEETPQKPQAERELPGIWVSDTETEAPRLRALDNIKDPGGVSARDIDEGIEVSRSPNVEPKGTGSPSLISKAARQQQEPSPSVGSWDLGISGSSGRLAPCSLRHNNGGPPASGRAVPEARRPTRYFETLSNCGNCVYCRQDA